MTAVDRTPKPCTHPRARHKHGTYLAYKRDGCRCAPCTRAYRRHSKTTEYRTVTGTHSYVPAEPARQHVEQLLEVLTVSQVEQRSGVHRTAIRVLVGDFPGRPASKRIARRTEAALLAVRDDRIGAEQHGLVDGTGTRRRLRALIALGWPAKTLQGRLGGSSRSTWYLTNPEIGESTPVRATTRDAVRALYDELSLTVPPPSRAVTRARGIAAARRWVPPLAWDDEAIDDPAARPSRGVALRRNLGTVFDEVAVERAMAGDQVHLRPVERAEAVRRLTDSGYSAMAIAERLQVDARSVQRIRDEQRQAQEAAA